jgi:hypothetical protein
MSQSPPNDPMEEEIIKIYEKLKDSAPNRIYNFLWLYLGIEVPEDLRELFFEIETKYDFLSWIMGLINFVEYGEYMFEVIQLLYVYMKDFKRRFYDPLFLEDVDTKQFFQYIKDQLHLEF